MEPCFRSGEVIVRREILEGREWMVYPLRVVADDGVLLAAYLAKGTPLSFGGGEFKWGPHPWVHFEHTWQSDGVLQLQRAGDGYSVWARLKDGELQDWYVNFQEPLRRTAHGFDTLDQELDLVIAADGSSYTWKDVDHFEERVHAGGFGPGEPEAVRAAAAEVVELIESGGRWWEGWSAWRPSPEFSEAPASVALSDTRASWERTDTGRVPTSS
ncbi:DUF402 domain-containing protein [Streptomyces sp. NPDC048416]|uniref:DUF402 domain-containing protein n=1 Tax=Streptomyces sp. NPDC048416 TaxID=3365546 RepID=UPI003711FCF5